MIGFFRRLLKDSRGNAILIAGAALPVVVGFAGLGTDTVQWVLWKRELQRAADSAAFAAVYANSAGDSVSQAVTTDLTNNNSVATRAGISLMSGYPLVTAVTSPNYTFGQNVQLKIQRRLSFSALFLPSAPIISASATAGLIDQGNYCAWALRKSGGAGITIGGSSNTNLGCSALSNSNSNPSVATNGSAYNFSAPDMAGVGSLPSAITGVTTLKPYHMAMTDPYAGKYSTAIPSGCAEKTLTQNTYTTGTGQSRVTHLYSYETRSVCYSSFKFTGGTYYLDAGTYYIDSADFDTTGGTTLIGTGVTIILTGTSPGSVKMAGNATIQLGAPTTGVYKNMLFIQSASASTNNGNTINGNSLSSFDGAFYFPNGQVSFSGSSGASTKCAMVIGYELVFTGNTQLQNNTTGCSNNTTVKGKAIRLVA